MHRVCDLLLLAGIVSAMPRNLEGEVCSVGGAAGVCLRVSSCPSVQAAIRQGSVPVRCGFLGKQEVVCCPKDKPDSRVTHTRRQIRVSQQKCQFYTDLYQKSPQDLIINGTSAEEAEFPHIAALGYITQGNSELNWACAGSLISEQFVLTAAHCCTILGKPVRVQLGVNDLKSDQDASSMYDVDQKNIIVHPEFKKPYNDIALVKLAKKVILSTFISPVCLYDAPDDPPGLLTVAGWGAINALGTRSSSTLLKTRIQAVPKTQCEIEYKTELSRGVDNSVICAGDPTGLTDTCQGDSGGPLQIKQDGKTFIVGITSLGKMPCGSPIGVYVRVSNFMDWIEKKVWT